MAGAVITLLGHQLRVPCAEGDVARVEDLARVLEARLEGVVADGDSDAVRRIALAALALTAENQKVRAALERAHLQVDRLNEMLAAARPRPELRAVAGGRAAS